MSFLPRCLIAVLVFGANALCMAQEFKAGVGRADITPQEPVWLGGYESRTKPNEGVAQKIHVKALALQDSTGATTLIVTADSIGTPREFTEDIAARIERELHIPRSRFLIASSHSHAVPMVLPGLPNMAPTDEAQIAALNRYSKFFKEQIFAASKDALANLQPASLQFSRGNAGFAINRRIFTERGVTLGMNPTGLVDHDVPVLRVLGADHSLKAVVFGYACHCTTLGPDFYQVCGDWATYAQDYLEEAYPGATALFVTGCAGDSWSTPRTTLALAREHGLELAGAVSRALKNEPTNVHGPISVAFERVDLPLTEPPTKEQLEKRAAIWTAAKQRNSKLQLEILARDGKLMTSYPCPVQVLRFGNDLTLVALGGEVVVDYAFRLKRELPNERLWVAAYCNDVFAYVPSMRILQEGGYEADFNLVYYGLPCRFAPSVENVLVNKVIALTKQAAGQ